MSTFYVGIQLLLISSVNANPSYEYVREITSEEETMSTFNNNGWRQIGSNWHYYRNGQRLVGWHRVRTSATNATLNWFFFNANGVMQTRWQNVQTSNTNSTLNWFYLGTNGIMRTGWQWTVVSNTNSTRTYGYFGTNGIWRRNANFIRPLSSGEVTSEFGMRNGSMHYGIDLQDIHMPTTAIIRASAPGLVVQTGNSGNAHGITVIIRHSINNRTYYTLHAHMSRVNVTNNTWVSQGDNLGTTGTSGVVNSFGHLHFEIHERTQGNRVNPRGHINFPLIGVRWTPTNGRILVEASTPWVVEDVDYSGEYLIATLTSGYWSNQVENYMRLFRYDGTGILINEGDIVREFSWRIADDLLIEILEENLIVGFIGIAHGIQNELTIIQGDMVSRTNYVLIDHN